MEKRVKSVLVERDRNQIEVLVAALDVLKVLHFELNLAGDEKAETVNASLLALNDTICSIWDAEKDVPVAKSCPGE